jgi:glycosyltransferase involved in cell wall biosynthesis
MEHAPIDRPQKTALHYAQVIDHLGPGGTQKMVALLVSCLAERNIRVTAISLSDEDIDSPICRQIEACGARVVHFPGKHLLDPARIFRLAHFLRQEEFTLLQSYLTYANILTAVAGRSANVPVIGSLRSIKPTPIHYKPAVRFIETLCLRYLDRRVMVNAYAIAEWNQKRLGSKRMDVIPNAIEVPTPISTEARQKIRVVLSGSNRRPIIISAGRLVTIKEFPTLIQAVNRVRETVPDVQLWIVGDGDEMANLDRLVHELGLQEHVALLGQRNDVQDLLFASDIYVSASSIEGMSVAILEAMSSGLPVIATDVGDARKTLGEGTGCLIPPKQVQPLVDALLDLLADPERRAQMGTAARDRIASVYNTSVWAEQFLDLYQRILSR